MSDNELYSSNNNDSNNNEDTADDQMTVIIGTVTSQQTLKSIDSYLDRLFKSVQINDLRTVNMKIDTGADTCIMAVDNFPALNLSLDIQPCAAGLKGYGGQQVTNLGTTSFKVRYKDKSVSTRFTIVDVPGQASKVFCRQAQELGLITASIQEDTKSSTTPTATKIHET